jgi:hypothetical protein
VLIIALVIAICLAAGALVLYYNPPAVKMLIENALSQRLGTRVSIGELEYGVDPLRVHVGNMTALEEGAESGFSFRMEKLDAAFALEGPFAHRTLVLERLALSGLSLRAGSRVAWSRFMAEGGPPSALSRLAARASALLLARDVQIGTVELTDGAADLRTEDLQFLLQSLRADSSPGGVRLMGKARILHAAAEAALEVPQFDVRVNADLSLDRSVLDAHLDLPDVRYESPRTAADINRLQAQIKLVLDAARFELKDGRAECREIAFTAGGGRTTAVPAPQLRMAGVFRRAERVLTLSSWQLVVAKAIDLQGKAEIRLSEPREVDLTLEDGVVFPGALMAPIFKAAGVAAALLSVAGPVALSGSLRLKAAEQGWVEEGLLTAVFDQNAVTSREGPLQAEGIVSGRLTASGRAAEPKFALELTGRNFTLSGSGMKAKTIGFDLTAHGSYPAFSVPLFEARIPAAEFNAGGKRVSLSELRLTANGGTLDAEAASVSFPEIVLDSSALKHLKGSLAGDRQQLVIEAAGDDTGLIAAAAKFGFLPAAWRFGAADRLTAKAVVEPAGDSRLAATIALSRLGFSDAGESRVGEGIELNAEIDARYLRKGKSLTVAAALTSDAGEFLWNRFYLDLGKHPAAFSTALSLPAAGTTLAIREARLTLANLLTLTAHGQVAPRGSKTAYALSLTLPDVPITPLFENLVAEPLRYRQPALAGIQIDGRVSAELELNGEGGQAAFRGLAEWHSGNLATPDKDVRLEGIEFTLPLWHREGSGGDGPPLKGGLSVRRVALPMLPAQDVNLPLTVGPDQLTTTGELQVRFPSGALRIGPIACRDIFSAAPKFKTEAAVDRVQVGEFLKGIWSEPVDALVSGRLPEIAFDGRSLSSRGRLTADIFGGKIIFENLGVSGALSAAPNLHMDCSIRELNLSRLTRNTSFGGIQGILSGHVNDLEVVNGQPQRFTLLLETVRKPGIPQRINVAAVENIARIGGGQSPFVGLAGNFAAFFKEFTYDKIGVRAVLENDLFRINGTAKENGVEYLVKKGGIPGVDVVNLNPDNQISFRDMVKRIQRVTESKSGPVVK